MADNITGCRDCGRLDSALRFYRLFDGQTGVWCREHVFQAWRRAIKHRREQGELEELIFGPSKLKDRHGREMDLRIVPYAVVLLDSADLLRVVADTLRARGEAKEADRARKQSSRLEKRARDALQHITYDESDRHIRLSQ